MDKENLFGGVELVDGPSELDLGYAIFERSNYSMWLPYEQKFRIPLLETWSLTPIPWTKWFQNNWLNTVYLSLAYVLVVVLGRKYMESRPAYELRSLLIGWNWALALFSLCGALRMLEELTAVVEQNGFPTTVCYTVQQLQVAAIWCFYFAVSKVVELFDTAFLVLRKRPVTLLHLYHHASVMVYTWHSGAEHTAAARWFITINYSVHAVMYTYFALKAQGSRVPRPVSMAVTTMQLVQMLAGLYINYTVYSIKTSGKKCQQSWTNLYMCWVIYATYFLLFLKFFFDSYVLNKKQQVKRD